MNHHSMANWSGGLILASVIGLACLASRSAIGDSSASPSTQPSDPPATMPSTQIPAVGTDAPAFTLTSNTGQPVSLSDYAGKKIVVLYFYPKAFTPGCTKEACAFRDSLADYDKANIAVIGISTDPVDKITQFGTSYHLNFPLVSDADHAVALAYGVWQPRVNKDGETVMGTARTTFVIGKDGKILHVFEKVKPAGHDKEVLAWIQQDGLLPAN
jgi:thioredoxin-dependent peroxiredoxin